MSSDTSPPSGYQLETQPRPGDEARGAPRRPLRPPDPPWLTVIATTLRLWLRRRVLRVPDSAQVGMLHRAGLAALAFVVLAGAAAGTALALAASSPGRPAPRHHRPAKPVVTPAEAAAMANGKAAAAWIAAQVSQQAMVDCDPAMCGYLQAAGYPAGQIVMLQKGVSLPASSGQAGPGGVTGAPVATLIADTAVLRLQYGAQLATAAPAVLASFGAGQEAVQLRLFVAGGASGYQKDTSQALAARRSAGRALLAAGRAHMHPAAQQDLRNGLVDPRLIVVLRRLSASYSFYVVSFTDGTPLASSWAPFRVAAIDGLVTQNGPRLASDLGGVLKLLKAQPAAYLAQLTVTHLATGRVIVTIEFPAPSPP